MEEEQCLAPILRLSNPLTYYTRNITHVISRVSYVCCLQMDHEISRALLPMNIHYYLHRVAQFNFNFLANLLYSIALHMLITLRAILLIYLSTRLSTQMFFLRKQQQLRQNSFNNKSKLFS